MTSLRLTVSEINGSQIRFGPQENAACVNQGFKMDIRSLVPDIAGFSRYAKIQRHFERAKPRGGELAIDDHAGQSRMAAVYFIGGISRQIEKSSQRKGIL